MKIAHIADIHQGLHYAGPSPLSRFQDIEKILDWTADKLIEEKVDLCLICGDCFKDAKVMLDRASQEIASIVRFLRKLSDARITTILISGTPSHDAIPAYDLIDAMSIPRLIVWTKPGVNRLRNIACLPGLNRSALLTQDEYKGLPPEQVHRIMTDKITQLCVGMAGQMPNDKPKILMAHMTYQGAETGFTDLLMQNEPILTREAVAGFDLVCLGHIHRPQQIDNKVFYSGPIERLSFNDEDIDPGFMIYESHENSLFNAFTGQFIKTPARKYLTIDLDLRNTDYVQEVLKWELAGISDGGTLLMFDTVGAIVRFHYKCTEEQAKLLNRKEIESLLYKGGAFYVQEIKQEIERVDRVRDSQVTESIGPLDALTFWAANQGMSYEESQALTVMTMELLEGVQA